MTKTEVYSWRLTPETKSRLEEAARERRTSLAELLGEITEEWLEEQRFEGVDGEREARIRSTAMSFVGAIRGGDPDRSTRARAGVRSRLVARRVR